MAESSLDAVTGAFSFTGRAIAARLLAEGREVVTLVRRETPNPFDDRIRIAPFALDDPERLAASLVGVDTLYNTYWIRFERGAMTFEVAIAGTLRLIEAARRAGVRRLVHVSVVNASETAPTPYFQAKARLEGHVRESGLSHAIVRPTLTFGPGSTVVNNLCWVLRRLPLFGVPGDGRYRLQPVHVDDVAAIAVEAGRQTNDLTTDAAGPDTFAFDELVRLLGSAVGRRPRLVHLPPELAWGASQMLGLLVRDVMSTRTELVELMRSLLVSRQPPRGTISLRDWVMEEGPRLGLRYHSELDRHFRPT
ncbi:MAG: NAD-dependent epimerase/dehydratase family protein [Candidatus Limnocylindria bacterium]